MHFAVLTSNLKQSAGLEGNHSYGPGMVLGVVLGSSSGLFLYCAGVQVKKHLLCGERHFHLAFPPMVPRGGLGEVLMVGI